MSASTPRINRREFLRFKTQDSRRIAEIDCQRLHMNYLTLQVTTVRATVEHDDFADGEPPPVFASRGLQNVFAEMGRELQDADLLRVLDRRWLVPAELRLAFDEFLQAYLRNGGAVEYTT